GDVAGHRPAVAAGASFPILGCARHPTRGPASTLLRAGVPARRIRRRDSRRAGRPRPDHGIRKGRYSVAVLQWEALDERAVDTARVLAADAVQKKGNGHPGTAISLAPA